MTNMLITGGTGRLGRALKREFPGAKFPMRKELDLCDDRIVESWVAHHRPPQVIHAAAMTDVRKAQQEQEACWDVNVRGTERLVHALLRHVPNCYFVYISTACVFAGDRGDYNETDIPHPKNFYALSKLVGEYVGQRLPNHLVVRTNFVERAPWPYPQAFTDRFGTYLFADDVARGLRHLLEQRLTGLVHLAGDQRLSMYQLARRTSPDVGQMTMADVQLPLTVDMTLCSVRIPHMSIS